MQLIILQNSRMRKNRHTTIALFITPTILHEVLVIGIECVFLSLNTNGRMLLCLLCLIETLLNPTTYIHGMASSVWYGITMPLPAFLPYIFGITRYDRTMKSTTTPTVFRAVP
jgi:hypothetical protein